jgi:hypothetical protein
LSADSLDDLVPKIPIPEDVRNSFLPRKDPQFTQYDNRTPGLFKGKIVFRNNTEKYILTFPENYF